MILRGGWKVPELLRYRFEGRPVDAGIRIERWVVGLSVRTVEGEQPIVLNGIIKLNLSDSEGLPQLTCRQKFFVLNPKRHRLSGTYYAPRISV
ncbi:hypothetical protein ACFDR9_002807 [Janthinobacterium sp. CG_23.3]|uniref:hypothetical protein n=1 Tax=Janthinobacterium sp. CG_23.3 TaxID=3349634 RepID=UPI0038D4C629